MMFKGSSSRYYGLKSMNCPDLVIGLERAEASEGKNGIQKVKKDERNASIKQEHTDAFDIPIWSIYKDLLRPDREYWDLPTTV